MKPKDKTLMKGETTPAPATETPATPAATPAAAQEATPAPAAPVAVQVEKGQFQLAAEKVLADVPVSKALAMEQKDMFFAMSDALMSFAMGMDMIQADLMAFMASDGKTGFMGTEVVKSLKTEFPQATEAEIVEKAGKKMKKERLWRMKELHEGLGKLIGELDDEETNVTKGGTVKTDTTTQETNKSADGAAAAPASTQAANETPAAAPAQASGLTAAQIEEIVTKSVKAATEPLQKEIEALKGAPTAPAGEGSDASEDVATNKSATGGEGAGKKSESIFKGLIKA